MNSITTGDGDLGDTGILGSDRLQKCHPRIEAYGAVDELNSDLGVCLSMLAASKASIPPALDPQLREIQSMLFSMGADLAQQDCGLKGGASPRIGQPHVDRLTDWIHRWEADLPPLKEFILPGGDPIGAQLHRARTTCRRAERRTVEFSGSTGEGKSAVVALNRISDLLFLHARGANLALGHQDTPWKSILDL
ncbi:MAG: cob(I)yrinic acid a,c-diamide adenosyltransferase [Planctomycetota bacterium]|jgi:cob(I)alamin adenosyltransferase|nr:cob(I)yrinic acid a,c-diamide adenosyltransferase [Planctomycetota bacterium]